MTGIINNKQQDENNKNDQHQNSSSSSSVEQSRESNITFDNDNTQTCEESNIQGNTINSELKQLNDNHLDDGSLLNGRRDSNDDEIVDGQEKEKQATDIKNYSEEEEEEAGIKGLNEQEEINLFSTSSKRSFLINKSTNNFNEDDSFEKSESNMLPITTTTTTTFSSSSSSSAILDDKGSNFSLADRNANNNQQTITLNAPNTKAKSHHLTNNMMDLDVGYSKNKDLFIDNNVSCRINNEKQPQSNSNSNLTTNKNKIICNECSKPINDRYIMRMFSSIEQQQIAKATSLNNDGFIDENCLSFHENCLKCSNCNCLLEKSCFVKGTKLLCSQDYYK